MIQRTFKKFYGNSVVAANLRGQARIPYLPREELHALRDRRVRKIVRYAAKTVPYYQEMFQTEGIDPRDIRCAEDLSGLPLTDKEVVRRNPRIFVSGSRKGRKAIPFVTSGSTNMPVEFMHDQYSLLANIAYGEREREVIRKTCGRDLKYREVRISPRSTRAKVWDFYRQATFIPVRPGRLVLPVSGKVEDNLREINRFRPDIIVGFGSYLEALFRTVDMLGLQIHIPKGVVCVGDAITADGKKFITEKFALPVLARYNAGEAFKIGYSCELGTGLHIHEDLCHLRIVDQSGVEVPHGVRGEVVISNLVNRGTVLLNYRLGDLASMSNEPCTCGRTFQMISELAGRVQDIIHQPDGTFIHPDSVLRVFKGREGVVQYQLIQREMERFELKLVTVDEAAYQRIIGDVIGDLRELLGKSARIDSSYCAELQRHKGGKFRPVISEVRAEKSKLRS